MVESGVPVVVLLGSHCTAGDAKGLVADRSVFAGGGMRHSLDGILLMKVEVERPECKKVCGESSEKSL